MSKTGLQYNLDIEERSDWLFISAAPNIKSRFPYVQELGNFYCHDNYYTKRHDLESYYMAYTASGSGILEYRDNVYQLEPFQLFWIDCQNYQKYYTNPEVGEWHQVWIHFWGKSCKKYYDMFIKENNGKNAVTMSTNNRIREQIERLIVMYKEGNKLSSDTRAISVITDLMTQCMLATSVADSHSPYPEFIKDAIAYIQNNYQSKISLDILAKELSVNKYHFHRMFKKFLGTTPNEYVITTRLNKAKELLRTTNLQVNEIAPLVGIDNVSHFINTFKKAEGSTPMEYSHNWYR